MATQASRQPRGSRARAGHQTGYPDSGENRFKPKNKERIEAIGGEVYLGSDVLTNSIRHRQRLGPSPFSYITQVLIGMRVKVNVDIVAKASDAGLLIPGERVISIAGSHYGANTAVVFDAHDSVHILEIKPREIIAMPLSRQRANDEYMKRLRAAQTS